MKDVHLFLPPGMADWEPGYAISHIARPAPEMPARYRVRTVGLDRQPIHSMGGLTLLPDLDVVELSPQHSSMLILPGSDAWMAPGLETVQEKVREFVDAGVPVAAICGATWSLACAGVLDGRRHTSNAKQFLELTGYAGADHYAEQPAVDAEGVITASGTAPLEFAKLILARLEVFTPAALEAWYGLYKTGEAAYYFQFMEAVQHGEAANE